MKRFMYSLCIIAVLTSSAFAQMSERGIDGASNEVSDPTFTGAESGYWNTTPCWDIDDYDEEYQGQYYGWHTFQYMTAGVDGYAFDHDQYPDHYSILTANLNAEDSGLYDPSATQQKLHFSFFAHVDNFGYVNIAIYGWDPESGPEYGPPNTVINLTINDDDEDGSYTISDGFEVSTPVDEFDNPLVYHEYEYYEDQGEYGGGWVQAQKVYDLYSFDVLLSENPQWMMLEITIGHGPNAPEPGPAPSSAYITDVWLQQQSVAGAVVVPEPTTCVLLLSGLVAGFVARRRNK